MDAIVHIGTTKTGTSSIQQFLATNDVLLSRHGILYPKAGRVQGKLAMQRHVALTLSLLPIDRDPTGFDRRLGLNSRQKRQRFRERFFEEFDAEMRDATAGRVVISDEALSNFLAEREIGELRSVLDRYFEQVTIVVYLRHPVTFAESAYSQHLKLGGTKTLAEFVADLQLSLAYSARLKAWRNAFGADGLKVREFSRAALEGGDAVEDFCASFLDLKVSAEGHQRLVSVNRSITPLGQILLLAINRYYESRGIHRPPFFRNYISKKFPGSGRSLDASQAAALNASIAEEMEALSSEFFGGREIFAKPPDRKESAPLDEEAMAIAAAEMSVTAFERGADAGRHRRREPERTTAGKKRRLFTFRSK